MKLLYLIPFVGAALAATKQKFVNSKVVSTTDYDSTYETAIQLNDAGMVAAEELFEALFDTAITTAVAANGDLEDISAKWEADSDGNKITADVYAIASDKADSPKAQFMVEFAYTYTDEAQDTADNNKIVTDWVDSLTSEAQFTDISGTAVADKSTAGTGSIAFTAALVAGMLALRN